MYTFHSTAYQILVPDTYPEALKKLKDLEVKENVFTSETEEDSSQVKKNVEKAMKQNALLKQAKQLSENFAHAEVVHASLRNSDSGSQ